MDNNSNASQNNSNLMVTLVPSEGENITVPLKVANVSKLFKTMNEDVDDDEDEIEVIPVPNVTHKTLKKVLEFCEYFLEHGMDEIEKPLRSQIMTEIVSEWYANYIDIDNIEIFNIVSAANYLDILELLQLGCAKVASMIKGKTPEEIKKEFNIENDLTEEEKESITQEQSIIDGTKS